MYMYNTYVYIYIYIYNPPAAAAAGDASAPERAAEGAPSEELSPTSPGEPGEGLEDASQELGPAPMQDGPAFLEISDLPDLEAKGLEAEESLLSM